MHWTWAKPANLWQWLLLFTPALVSIAAPLLGDLLDPWLYPNKSAEGHAWAWTIWGFIGLLIALLMSAALGFWLARNNDSFGKKAIGAAVCTLALIGVNGFVAFAGCALGSAVLR